MPMSRPRKNIMRKAIKPASGTPAQKEGPCCNPAIQYKQTGKKYSGPNYPQKGARDDAKGSGK